METQVMTLITANEAAPIIGVSPDLVRRYVSSGRLASVREGGRILIPREAAEKFVSICKRCYVRFIPKDENADLCPSCVKLNRVDK